MVEGHGHEWEAVIHSRNKGIGCPKCHSKNLIARTRLNLFESVSNRIKKSIGYEIDIYI